VGPTVINVRPLSKALNQERSSIVTSQVRQDIVHDFLDTQRLLTSDVKSDLYTANIRWQRVDPKGNYDPDGPFLNVPISYTYWLCYAKQIEEDMMQYAATEESHRYRLPQFTDNQLLDQEQELPTKLRGRTQDDVISTRIFLLFDITNFSFIMKSYHEVKKNTITESWINLPFPITCLLPMLVHRLTRVTDRFGMELHDLNQDIGWFEFVKYIRDTKQIAKSRNYGFKLFVPYKLLHRVLLPLTLTPNLIRALDVLDATSLVETATIFSNETQRQLEDVNLDEDDLPYTYNYTSRVDVVHDGFWVRWI